MEEENRQLTYTVEVRDFLPYTAFHNLIWQGMETPITYEEVEAATPIENSELQKMRQTVREFHAGRILWFSKQEFIEPITFGGDVDSNYEIWTVIDGNHRLAAATFRADKTIRVTIDGCESAFVEMFPSAKFFERVGKV